MQYSAITCRAQQDTGSANTLSLVQELGLFYHIDDFGRDEPFIGEILPAGEIVRRMTSEAKASLDRLAALRQAA